jgi:hypothetical protein
MRLIVLFYITSLLILASEFPDTFNSAGDEVYENMQKYLKIKHLKMYQDRPEFLESFCMDANTSMQQGFTLDRAKEDPEAKVDKNMIKSYAKELRRLSNQNEAIEMQLQVDIKKLYEAGDMNSLAQIAEAGFFLDEKILKAIEEDKKQQAMNETIARANLLQAEQSAAEQVKKPKVKETTAAAQTMSIAVANPVAKAVVPEPISKTVTEVSIPVKTIIPEQVEAVEEASAPVENLASTKVEEPVQVIAKPARKPTKLEYYQQSLVNLKEELYALRESRESKGLDANVTLAEQTKTACLNDITAINYWMIKVLENEKDACVLSDAIRQMKSYDKSAAASCGRDSMRYIEWHARIKPYVGSRLFKAEALCPR